MCPTSTASAVNPINIGSPTATITTTPPRCRRRLASILPARIPTSLGLLSMAYGLWPIADGLRLGRRLRRRRGGRGQHHDLGAARGLGVTARRQRSAVRLEDDRGLLRIEPLHARGGQVAGGRVDHLARE